jgi:DNA-binding response OmpR family regulator
MSEPSVPRQVLIIEDDARVRSALREVFVIDGYQCRVAANGREGLDIFQR